MNLEEKKKLLRDIVEEAVQNLPSNRFLAPGTWGLRNVSGDGDYGSTCLVGAIGVKYDPHLDKISDGDEYHEYEPLAVLPLIRNGASKVIDDIVLAGLNIGFEKFTHGDPLAGWDAPFEGNEEGLEDFYRRLEKQKGLFDFACSLGAEIRERYEAGEFKAERRGK